MEFNQILELIKTISDSNVTSFKLEEGDKVISIKTGENNQPQIVQMQAPMAAPMMQPVMPSMAAPMATAEMSAPQVVAESANVTEDKSVKTVTSPLVGTFYSAPSPDAAPYISVGDTVKKGQVIGIVEAMKLMNEIESEHDGVVTEIMVNNGDMVEYGQVLVKVK
ncbi:MAG: acetyl-CoA carboxylase biotin carboxyl carrier protein [Lachnospiraceae bacterium]|nr:acetyl-CoA carboxylase biotin carboxyl carrier protein [Lachnospiraceae bacterium]